MRTNMYFIYVGNVYSPTIGEGIHDFLIMANVAANPLGFVKSFAESGCLDGIGGTFLYVYDSRNKRVAVYNLISQEYVPNSGTYV